MFDLGKQNIDFSCPGCGRKNRVSLQQVSSQNTIICSGCRKSIKLTDKNGSAGKTVRDVNNAIRDLENVFKRLK